MEQNHSGKEGSLPPLIKAISAHEVVGFDTQPLNIRIEGAIIDDSKSQRVHSISISVPPSPVGSHNTPLSVRDQTRDHNPNSVFYSQPMSKGGTDPGIDRRFDSFKTWSGQLERQFSNLRGNNRQTEQPNKHSEFENLPVDRYFDALEGPELDTLRDSEEILLPNDQQWPFLLRFPITSFSMCLGVSSQAIMWKALSSSASTSTSYLPISPNINLVLWFISVALFLIISLIYSLKIILYFEAVRREYFHPVRVNFFFAPLIVLLFLAHGLPPSVSRTLHSSLWYVLMAPILCLEVKIYGQWMSGGQRRLSKVANPTNHLSIVGNFVGALLGASMGLKEGPIFFFSVGLAHYVVLFVTLYQRLPSNVTLPKELHPVFFLFVAAPSVASMAWTRMQGSFDFGSRIAYFIALFLYGSLAVRVDFFRGFRFSLAWWAYTFPMTAAAVSTIKYSDAVNTMATKTLVIILCLVATLIVTAMLVTTIIHIFVLRDLFPNDIAIAIAERHPKTSKKWYHMRSSSSNSNIEQYLKYANSDGKDIEVSVDSPSPNNQDSPV
ncbi:hypothetical protein ACS0TY_004622 [Phlomoides rotata]